MTRVNIIREPTFFFYNQRVNYFVFIIRESTVFFFIIRESTIYALLPVCFPFLCWVKFCSGYFRQDFFSLGRQKKWLQVMLHRWWSYTVKIVWEFTWAD